jgi:hypothetical protein
MDKVMTEKQKKYLSTKMSENLKHFTELVDALDISRDPKSLMRFFAAYFAYDEAVPRLGDYEIFKFCMEWIKEDQK